MSLNLSELQQKANQVLFNSDEAIRKWVEFISAPAGNVSFQYYDRNGNLQQVNFDNRNKLVQNFISNVNSAMNKIFYVDAVNGNDGNDGSQNAPFKTLKKAVDSVPVGGYGYIILKSDIELANEPSYIGFNYKAISIQLNGNTLSKTNTTNRFYCDGGVGFILFSAPTADSIITIDNSNNTSNVYYQKALIHFDSNAFGLVYFGWDGNKRIKINTDTHVIFATRCTTYANIIGCDFTAINNTTGLYVSAHPTNEIVNAYGVYNTGIDGTNIKALSGQANHY